MNDQSTAVFLDRYALRDPQGNLLEQEYGQLVDRLVNKFAVDSVEDFEYSEMLSAFNFIPGGRILSASGRDATLFNCFVLPLSSSERAHGADSRRAILDTTSDIIEVTSRGGGAGVNWSTLRPNGAYISGVNGESSGSVAWMRGVDSMVDQIRQGGSRTAALMWMLNDWHPDLPEFLNQTERFKRANFSVGISNKFMRSVRNNEEWEFYFPNTNHRAYDTKWDGDIDKWVHKFGRDQCKHYGSIRARDLFRQIATSASNLGSPGMVFMDTCQQMSNTHYLDEIVATNPCVIGDTLVQTVEGQIPIRELVGKEIDVYCVDDDYDLTINKAKNIRMTQKDAALVKVITTKGVVICTPDHRFYTRNRGYVPAFDLKTDDKVVALNKSLQNECYAKVYLSGRTANVTGEHRFVAQHYHGDLVNMDVHHIDGNKLNNSFSNLEVMNHSDHSVISNIGHVDWSDRDAKTGQFLPKLSNTRKRDLSNSFGTHPTGVNMRLIEVIPLDYTEDVYDLEVENWHNFFANHVLMHNCGEQPLPPYGSCNLGSVNLVKIWDEKDGSIDHYLLNRTVENAVKFMDRVTDLSKDILKQIGDAQRGIRRIGIGTMGLADVLIQAEIRYGSAECLKFIDEVYSSIRDCAYITSTQLAVELGSAPYFDAEEYLQGKFIRTLPKSIREQIQCDGIRNLALLSQAPTGTTALLAGVSSGIEPIFSSMYTRTDATGTHKMCHEAFIGKKDEDYLVTAHDVSVSEHIAVQARVQKYIDSAVSKTINMPACSTIEDISNAYMLAWKSGCKGITVFKDGSLNGVCEICEMN